LDHRDAVGRIGVEFRVGITGHRSFCDRSRVSENVRIALERVLEHQSVRSTKTTPVGLTIVSALAEGADRILIEQARAVGPFRLEAILPMAPEAYIDDFKTRESRDEFNNLLAEAATTVVVAQAENREAAYALAGQAVVDRSDVVIAAWDEKPPRGSGGTAGTVAYARAHRVPLFIVRIDGTNRISPEWGDQAATSVHPIPISPQAFKELDRYNRRSVRASGSLIPTPLPTSMDDASASRLEMFVSWAAPYFQRADGIARDAQWRSLAVGRVLYVLASLAVGLFAAQLVFNWSKALSWVEFALLLSISAVLLGLWKIPTLHWHGTWIATRSLAERIRSAVFLGAAGIGTRMEVGMDPGTYTNVSDEWLTRAYNEVWLRRPSASIARADLGELQTLLTEFWIAGQIRYHTQTAQRNERLRELFRTSVLVLFALSVGVAFLDSWDPFGTGTGYKLVGFLAVAIPAFAAAVSGYGALREFGQLADKSRRMTDRLTDTIRRMESADSLEALQNLAFTAEQQMRGDTADWYSLVRLHKPDVPA
jgi:hypothetical protein